MPLFRTILIAADFSASSREAFRLACSIAGEDQIRLIVLHVVEPPIVYEGMGVSLPLDGEDRACHEALREQLRAAYVRDRSLDVEYTLRDGSPAEAILLATEEFGCDLVVLGTQGRTGLKRLLVGSVAEAVLRKARCSVLTLRDPNLLAEGTGAPAIAETIPDQASEQLRSAASRGEEPTFFPIRTILHPTDFSERSHEALQVARALARDRGARLIVLHVSTAPSALPVVLPIPVDYPLCRASLERIRQRIDGPDLKYPVKVRLARGGPGATIPRIAEEVGSDLIVMGTHGRTGLAGALMGSVAEAVMRRATCPVLTIKAPTVSEADIAPTAGAATPS